MSDIQYAIENSNFSLAHFDAWVHVSRALGHFWSSFSDDVMLVIRAVYAKSGWTAAHDAVKALAPLSGWGTSFAALGGIMPPTSTEHVHTTATGRLSISVDADGAAHVDVFRLVGETRVRVASYVISLGDTVATYTMPLDEWCAMGGSGSPVCQRHIDAVTEATRWL